MESTCQAMYTKHSFKVSRGHLVSHHLAKAEVDFVGGTIVPTRVSTNNGNLIPQLVPFQTRGQVVRENGSGTKFVYKTFRSVQALTNRITPCASLFTNDPASPIARVKVAGTKANVCVLVILPVYLADEQNAVVVEATVVVHPQRLLVLVDTTTEEVGAEEVATEVVEVEVVVNMVADQGVTAEADQEAMKEVEVKADLQGVIAMEDQEVMEAVEVKADLQGVIAVEDQEAMEVGVVKADLQGFIAVEDQEAMEAVVVKADLQGVIVVEDQEAMGEVEAKAARQVVMVEAGQEEDQAVQAVPMEVEVARVVVNQVVDTVEEVGAESLVEGVDTESEISLLVSRSPSPKTTSTRCIAPAIFTLCKFTYLRTKGDTDSRSINTPSGGEWAYECVDFANDLEHCSGEGVNCADIPHSLSVGCDAGRCVGKSMQCSSILPS